MFAVPGGTLTGRTSRGCPAPLVERRGRFDSGEEELVMHRQSRYPNSPEQRTPGGRCNGLRVDEGGEGARSSADSGKTSDGEELSESMNGTGTKAEKRHPGE